MSKYLDPVQDPAGWDVLGAGSAAWWDRAHLLSGWLDGPGERWNLVNAPRKVNKAMELKYETKLIDAARAGGRFHFEAHVDYHGANADPDLPEKQKINAKYDPSKFPEKITVGVKALGSVPDKLPDPSGQYSFDKIPLPLAKELAGFGEPKVALPAPIVRKAGAKNTS